VAWNRSTEPVKPVKKEVPPSMLKGIAAGIAAIVVISAALFLVFRGDSSDGRARTPAAPQKIKEATPAPAPKAASLPTWAPESHAQRDEELVTPDEKKDIVSQAELATNVHSSRIVTVRGNYEIFNHRSENMIAALVCAPVGTQIVGGPNFDDGFMQDLAAALVDKIEISPDDDEQTRYYKESVIAAKKELQALLKSGGDVREELIRTRKELQDLGVYKNQLEAEIGRMQRDPDNALSESDVGDLLEAANKMLKEKGIEPFEFNSLTKTIIRRKPFATAEEREAENEALENTDE